MANKKPLALYDGALRELDESDIIDNADIEALRISIATLECKDIDYNGISSDLDDNGIPRLTEYKRKNGTLYQKIYLSNLNIDGQYQSVTVTTYECDGISVKSTTESEIPL